MDDSQNQDSQANSELEETKQQRDEYLSGWQRAKADLINYKKEEAARLEETAKYGNMGLISEIIGILDDFDLALRVMEKEGGKDGVDKGIYLIRSKIEDVLRKRGLERIKISPGDPFDPSVAEAMLEIDSDKPPGAVVEEVEPGYRLHDKILRAAKVIVSREKGAGGREPG
ncbi:MAG: nucleotide exchange factor GrpE [Patescibacteria group bacterium]|nr:nucleotide exchange factor GrpE [Patescibacteria group bacterium]